MALCPLCKKNTEELNHDFEHFVLDRIKRSNPGWREEDGGCSRCITHYRLLNDPDDPIGPSRTEED